MKNFKDLKENLHKNGQEDKPAIMPYDEFYTQVAEFKFPEQTNSYYEYVRAQRAEKLLFEEAMRGGMRYLNWFRECQRAWHVEAMNHQHKELNEKHWERLKEAYKSGDEAYDKFTNMCRCHDYYYSYSDDINIWRNGEESYKLIQATINEQPPGRKELYQAYWQMIVDSHKTR